MVLDGFGFNPDDAIADLMRRASTPMYKGWEIVTGVHVTLGMNPYSMHPVHGHIARATLVKQVEQ